MSKKVKGIVIGLTILVVVLAAALTALLTPLGNALFEPRSGPQISLQLADSPLYSLEDEVYVFVVKAEVTGNPEPEIAFNRDDSMGAFGPETSVIYLKDDEAFTLMATASNNLAEAADSIELSSTEVSAAGLISRIDPSDNSGDSSTKEPQEPGENGGSNSEDNGRQGPEEESDNNDGPFGSNDDAADENDEPLQQSEPSNPSDESNENNNENGSIVIIERIPNFPGGGTSGFEVPMVYKEIDGSRVTGFTFGSKDVFHSQLFVVESKQWRINWEIEVVKPVGGKLPKNSFEICLHDGGGTLLYCETFKISSSDEPVQSGTYNFPADGNYPPFVYYIKINCENISATVYAQEYVPFISP